jgi:hypothetical protein
MNKSLETFKFSNRQAAFHDITIRQTKKSLFVAPRFLHYTVLCTCNYGEINKKNFTYCSVPQINLQ